jgi:cytochrome c oxidase cbb3-type subunit 3
MSDFMIPFWSIYVSVIALAGIFACLLLLWNTSHYKNTSSKDQSTGHVWDEDLKEMNNPLPLWWVIMFVISILFGLAYLFLYPGLGSYEGTFAWTSQNQYEAEVNQANETLKPLYARFDQMSIEEVAHDPQAHSIGERLFISNCSQCHGSDAQGSKSFPNLTDTDWLHGGSPENIQQTISKGRIGIMPPMGVAIGSVVDVANVAQYVLSLSHSPHDPIRADLGKVKFTTVCAACHGAKGLGNPLIGSANLTDNIWLHGSGSEAIIDMIQKGKTNQMPAQEGRLTSSQIRMLTAYVWGLSNVTNLATAPKVIKAQ